jgi:hypothetical protein
VSRVGVALLLVMTPLLMAAAHDPRGDVTSCAGGTTVTHPAADLVAVDGVAAELGSAAVWRLRFAAPIPVPDRDGAPLRIDVLVRDPLLPARSRGDERGMNRIVRWDDTASDHPIDVVWLDNGAHTPFNPPVIEGETIELRVPGRILLGEAENGTESVRRARWSVLVRDGDACDRLGNRPVLRLREPPSSTVAPLPTVPAPPEGTGSSRRAVLLVGLGAAIVLAVGLVWRRAIR